MQSKNHGPVSSRTGEKNAPDSGHSVKSPLANDISGECRVIGDSAEVDRLSQAVTNQVGPIL